MKAITRRQGSGRPVEAKGLDGRRRQDHYENGGTVAGWRGRSVRFVDRKKQADKLACRGGY